MLCTVLVPTPTTSGGATVTPQTVSLIALCPAPAFVGDPTTTVVTYGPLLTFREPGVITFREPGIVTYREPGTIGGR